MSGQKLRIRIHSTPLLDVGLLDGYIPDPQADAPPLLLDKPGVKTIFLKLLTGPVDQHVETALCTLALTPNTCSYLFV